MKKILWIMLIIFTTCFGFSSLSMASPTEAEYGFAHSFSEGYALVGIWEGTWKYGYIDRSGNLAIKPIFDYAADFSEGTALVGLGTDKESIKYGYIKSDGTYLFKPQFDSASPIKNGFGEVIKYKCKTLKSGIVDSSGKVIVKPIYDSVELPDYMVLRGYAEVINDDMRGLVNLKTGNVTETKYKSLLLSDKYVRTKSTVKGKDKFGLILLDGTIIEPIYDWIHTYENVNNVLCKVELNGKFGLIGADGKYVLEPKYDEIYNCLDGYAHVKLGNKYGYFDYNKTFLTKIEYDEIYTFVQGISQVKKNGKWGILNIDGTYKLKPKYDRISISENEIEVIENGVTKLLNRDGSYKYDSDYEYLYPYDSIEGAEVVKKNGKEIIIDSSGKPIFNVDFDSIGQFENGIARIYLDDKVGYLKRDGTYLVKPIYDSCYKDDKESYYHTTNNDLWGLVMEDSTVIKPVSSRPIHFKDNIGVVSIDSKETYIDKKGEFLIDTKFDNAFPFSEGMGQVRINNRTSYINSKGELMKNTFDFGYDFSDGYACVHNNGYYRFINKEGEYVFGSDAKFPVANSFSHGLAVIRSANGKWGYINTKGEIEIEFKFEGAYDFDEKLAPVIVENKFGFIDKSGKFIIEPIYDMITEFKNGISNVWINDKYGYITGDGEYKTTISENKSLEFYEGVAAVKTINSKENIYYWGYINEDGSWFIKPQFDFAGVFYDGTAVVYKDNKKGVLSKNGTIKWE